MTVLSSKEYFTNTMTSLTEEEIECCELINFLLECREKLFFDTSKNYSYNYRESKPPLDCSLVDSNCKKYLNLSDKFSYRFAVDGFYVVFDEDNLIPHKLPADMKTFYKVFHFGQRLMNNGAMNSFCKGRLNLLESRFSLYKLHAFEEERSEQKRESHRDFYNVRKVDNHIHAAAAMNQKELLRFIKKKFIDEPNEVVLIEDGKEITLTEVFENLNIVLYDLSLDTLDVHADRGIFHRFDRFNHKYNPFGNPTLRKIFLKTNNDIGGRYFAEILKQIIKRHEHEKYPHAELRLSIYGRSPNEWYELADWFVANDMTSTNIRWIIQIPRLYQLTKRSKRIETFAEMMQNVFSPLFDNAINPHKHPNLTFFLEHIVAFDSVDDESKYEKQHFSLFPLAYLWNIDADPPYSYYSYHMYANIFTLNEIRGINNMHPLLYRPHAGEAGNLDHLMTTFLTSHGIQHGINLKKSPFLTYLYYLEQLPMSISPLSNNALFVKYSQNPLPDFFNIGLNCSLSTDDPLQFHFTHEPLMEEYSICAQMWKFTGCDLCELAMRSCLMSGFDHETKKEFLGKDYSNPNKTQVNWLKKTNVPDCRIRYREDQLKEEISLIKKQAIPFHTALKDHFFDNDTIDLHDLDTHQELYNSFQPDASWFLTIDDMVKKLSFNPKKQMARLISNTRRNSIMEYDESPSLATHVAHTHNHSAIDLNNVDTFDDNFLDKF
eukprot:TRINITY_DN1612_c0_g1_i1.p1 TRINITY_DN1612_c0_g1~~TRINITY_DN1612_c0_g1_i1.p1  ORF type:complete len:717 (+),score=151.48 TRINITY_DN1612_c0_g1_i1:42-2192(+)